MCGRMAFDFTHNEVKKEFNIDKVMHEFSPSYNAAPSQMIPVIVSGSRILDLYKWGLIPSWAKDSKIGNKLINARSETLEEKPSFKYCFKTHRCIIVCSGFFEWIHTKGLKIPYFIKRKDKEIMALAGLFSVWHDQNGKIIRTCTVITTNANKHMEKFHDRMPVILEKSDIENWIDSKNQDIKKLKSLLKPFKKNLTSWRVTNEVNSPKNNKTGLIKEVKDLSSY